MKLQLLLPGIPVPVFSGGSSKICLTKIVVVYTDTKGVSSSVLVRILAYELCIVFLRPYTLCTLDHVSILKLASMRVNLGVESVDCSRDSVSVAL